MAGPCPPLVLLLAAPLNSVNSVAGDRQREIEREREGRKESRESRASARARSCAMDGALEYAPERRAQAQGALCREKDKERET